MTDRLYALGDVGATNLRIGVYNDRGEQGALYQTATDPADYEGTIGHIAETLDILSRDRGELVAASVAVAAEVGDDGVLTRSGGLSPWLGRNPGADLAQALDLPAELVGTPNDVVAIALSQQAVNLKNGRPARGIATTLSSGWGGALYWEEGGVTKSDEPGHEHLRDGATCPCGGEGHAEAFVSGKGVELNHGVSMSEWLADPVNAHQFVIDMSDSTLAMLERHAEDGFEAEEVRWTGGVALGQPFIMQRVAEDIRVRMPVAVDTVTMGEQAGLHGTLIDAKRRADQY